MPDAIERLRSAVDGLDGEVDPRELRQVIDALEKKFCELVYRLHQRGECLSNGFGSTAGWVAKMCGMSPTSVGDRLCVGEQLPAMPKVAAALDAGEISYQAASVVCHLRGQLGKQSGLLDEEQWIHNAQTLSIKELRYASLFARHAWDPEGFERDDEEDYDQRYLHLSQMGRMYRLDAMLDPEGGATLKSALDGLVKRLGPDDRRTPKQRRADALTEMVHHAMDQGTLPHRNGVRPHITVSTTVEALKGESGVPASELEGGMPVSSKDRPASRLQRNFDASRQSGVGRRRRRPGDPRSVTVPMASVEGAIRRLWVGGLRPADRLDECASHRVLGERRAEQRPQPASVVPLPPPPRSRGWMAGDPGRRRDQVHPAGADAHAAGARTWGGLGGVAVRSREHVN